MLLSDPAVACVIDREVVACWRMLQPAPLITIDFGDGRVIRRTLRGNTALYLCRPDGKVLDIYPGLYTAEDFLAELAGSLSLTRRLGLVEAGVGGEALIEEYRAGAALLVPLGARAPRGPRVSVGKAALEAPVLDAAAAKALLSQPSRQAARVLDKPKAHRINESKTDLEGPILHSAGVEAEEPGDVAVADGSGTLSPWRAAFARHAGRLIDASTTPRSAVEMRADWTDQERAATPTERGLIAVRRDSATNCAVLRPLARLLIASETELSTVPALRNRIFVDLLHVAIDDPDLGLRETLLPGTEDR